MKKNKDAAKKELLQLSPTLYADQVTYDKVHRHLRDINDTITEQDIENVRTDIVVIQHYESVENKMTVNGVGSNGQLSEKTEEKMYEEGKKITSSWNIVSE